MEHEQVYVTADNMLQICSGYNIIMPHSMQPTVHIQIPVRAYIEFVSSQIDAGILLMNGLYDFEFYQKAVKLYREGVGGYLRQAFFEDAFRICCLELKRALRHNRYATVITPQFESCTDTIAIADAASILNLKLNNLQGYVTAMQQAVSRINMFGDSVRIDYSLLDYHNKAYFDYLLLSYSEANYSALTGKAPVNYYNIR